MSQLIVKNVSKIFGEDDNLVHALSNVSFDVACILVTETSFSVFVFSAATDLVVFEVVTFDAAYTPVVTDNTPIVNIINNTHIFFDILKFLLLFSD